MDVGLVRSLDCVILCPPYKSFISLFFLSLEDELCASANIFIYLIVSWSCVYYILQTKYQQFKLFSLLTVNSIRAYTLLKVIHFIKWLYCHFESDFMRLLFLSIDYSSYSLIEYLAQLTLKVQGCTKSSKCYVSGYYVLCMY